VMLIDIFSGLAFFALQYGLTRHIYYEYTRQEQSLEPCMLLIIKAQGCIMQLCLVAAKSYFARCSNPLRQENGHQTKPLTTQLYNQILKPAIGSQS